MCQPERVFKTLPKASHDLVCCTIALNLATDLAVDRVRRSRRLTVAPTPLGNFGAWDRGADQW